MSKSKPSSRRIVSRVALFTAIGSSLLIFMAVGTSAASFSFMDSVKEFLGFQGAISTAASSSTASTEALPQPAGEAQKSAVEHRLDNPASNKRAAAFNDQSVAEPKIVRGRQGEVTVGKSYHNDTTPPLRDMRQYPMRPHEADDEFREANKNPLILNEHKDQQDPVVQSWLAPEIIPTPALNFNGIPFPGVACNCEPPDTNGEVGATQIFQTVNEGYQVFDKVTGTSVLGPASIVSVWAGFGGVCQTAGDGDPIVLYDQLAGRWLISQFAGSGVPTDECIAISTTSDATGSYNRYAFHLGTNFFDYPHLAIWPDGYYMSDNVFNSGGTARLGTQAFVFDRIAMLAGLPATFITPGLTPGGNAEPYPLPADLEGQNLPPVGTPCPFIAFPSGGTYKTYLYHADFVTPANSTYTLRTSPANMGFTQLCPGNRSCVPELGGSHVDGIGDRFMHRLTYRIIGGVERVVGNHTVSANAVAGIRWFELRNVTSGTESVFQESTYQPDTTWRWMGSIAQDTNGNMALGFSASDLTINPQIRYAGRLASDPINTLGQGETHLFDGTGSQTGVRWGDYSAMSVDPVDDCTFWYTTEYYLTNGDFNWRTRIGSFKFPSCSLAPSFTLAVTPPSLNICTPANAVYTVNTTSIQGFTDPVVLTATGNPAGTIATFSPNPVTPGQSSTLTISNTGAAAAGSYTINVKGTSGTIMLNQDVTLNVTTAMPNAPTLTAPANGATGQPLQPTFTWTASTQAATYTFEIATDAAFTNIVHTASGLTTTTYSNAHLSSDTPYFWRVRAINTCGTSPNSTAFSFRTALICIVPFSNTAPITINDNAAGSPYPSNIAVSGLTGTITKATVTLTGMSHTFPDDVDIMVVGPGGQNTLIMSDAGGGGDITNLNFTFDDDATDTLPDATQIVGGTFKPSNFDTTTDVFPAPAPAAGATVAMSVFNGTNPNGTWSLYVRDDLGVDVGSIAGGWTVTLTTTCGTPTPTATASPSISPTSTSTRTPTATSTSTGTPTPSPSCTPSTFTNSTLIDILDNGPANPYPSNITVAGLTGTVTKVTVDLTGMSHTFPDDVDIMLVGPGGQNTLLMSDTGGGGDITNLNFTFDDAAASGLPDATQIVGGTFQPTNFDTTTDVFPAPAPAPGATVAMSVFNGSSPNGTWSLYVRDDLGIDTGSITGGWTIHISTTGCSGISPTPTSTGSPIGTATSTATATPTGTPGCGSTFSYTGPAVAIPDNDTTGVNFTIPVSGVSSISDVNFRFDGVQSADPLSTTPGINHSFVGDLLVKVTSPGGTTVAVFDRPGVPVTAFGCPSNNLAQIILDDDGGFPAVEDQCGTDTTAFPTGTFSPNNPLSAFDGQNGNGNWTINISDNAAIDTGSARAFSLVFGGACQSMTPTATSTSTPTATPTASGASVQFSSATYTEDELQTAVITINRTGNTSGTNTVNFATSNGTATGGTTCTSGVDYISVNQAVTFNPNDVTKTVNVQICGDMLPEPTQTVNLALTGANVGSPGTAVLNINDTANAFRNEAAICTTFGSIGIPYPSTITVTNGPASIGSIRVTLYDVAHTIPDDMDFLLVGPGGQKFILMADSGGNVDLTTPVTLTFADNAGQVLPNSAPLTTGIFEPTSWEPGQSSFAAPAAPPAPYNEPGSAIGGTGTQTLIGNFGTTNANGVWSLYMRDDAGGNVPVAVTGCVNGGWGLEVFGSTAANASISGRVMTADGRGIRNAKVVITGNSLTEPIIATTGSFGYFTFDGLATGETYVVTVNSQRYTFSTPSRVISLIDNIADADFVANPQE